MIENIKQFVDEHRTLIVVIITVLIICFLYWLFCCKGGSSPDKVEGGLIELKNYRKYGFSGPVFECAGVKIEGEILFMVLNECGCSNVRRYSEAFKLFYTYIHDNLNKEDVYNLVNVVSRPVKIFDPDNKAPTVLRQFIIPAIKKKINENGGIEIMKLENVSFDKLKISNLGVRVVGRYKELLKFLSSPDLMNCIDKVNFIGQPSIYKTDDEKYINNLRKRKKFGTKFSPNTRGGVRW